MIPKANSIAWEIYVAGGTIHIELKTIYQGLRNRFCIDHPRKSAQPEGSFPKDIQQTTQ